MENLLLRTERMTLPYELTTLKNISGLNVNLQDVGRTVNEKF
jgi:hypothetical protein